MTIIELLIVMVIVALLVGLLVGAISKAREAANRTACANNLRQLALALHSYNENQKKLPPYCSSATSSSPGGSWWVHLMPYAEQEGMFQRIQAASAPITVPGGTISAVMPVDVQNQTYAMLQCPSDFSLAAVSYTIGTTNYLANWYVFGDGVSGCFGPAQRMTRITDGVSQTVLFAEGYGNCNGLARPAVYACDYHNFGITWDGKPSDDPMYLPTDYTMFQLRPSVSACDRLRTQTFHQDMPIALADGSVRNIRSSIDPNIWKDLLKPADGRSVNFD